MAVFKGQSALDIILDTEIPLANSRKLSILYIKPNGEKGEWVGVQEGSTSIKYSVAKRDLDQSGLWKLQSVVINSAGRRVFGEIVNLTVLPTLH